MKEYQLEYTITISGLIKFESSETNQTVLNEEALDALIGELPFDCEIDEEIMFEVNEL